MIPSRRMISISTQTPNLVLKMQMLFSVECLIGHVPAASDFSISSTSESTPGCSSEWRRNVLIRAGDNSESSIDLHWSSVTCLWVLLVYSSTRELNDLALSSWWGCTLWLHITATLRTNQNRVLHTWNDASYFWESSEIKRHISARNGRTSNNLEMFFNKHWRGHSIRLAKVRQDERLGTWLTLAF